MTPPMLGSWPVLIHAVRPFTIHGDQYYELHITRLDESPDGSGNELLAIKVPQHAPPSVPLEGQKLSVTFLMGQVTAATPL